MSEYDYRNFGISSNDELCEICKDDKVEVVTIFRPGRGTVSTPAICFLCFEKAKDDTL